MIKVKTFYVYEKGAMPWQQTFPSEFDMFFVICSFSILTEKLESWIPSEIYVSHGKWLYMRTYSRDLCIKRIYLCIYVHRYM